MKSTIFIFCLVLFAFICTSCEATVNPIPSIVIYNSSKEVIENLNGVYDFGDVKIGDELEAEFYIKNSGHVDVTLTGNPKIEITGQGTNVLTVQKEPSETITPGKQTSFSIKYAPINLTSVNALITVKFNNPEIEEYKFTVKGEGLKPVFKIYDSITNEIPDNVGSYDFGECVCFSTKQETFTIKNIGNSDLTLTHSPAIEIFGVDANGFSITMQPTTLIVPGDSTTFILEFKPKLGIDYSASIMIDSNDPSIEIYNFTILGKGLPLESEIHIKQGSNDIYNEYGIYDFELHKVGTTEAVTFVIQNNGVDNLYLSGNPIISIGGLDAADFTTNTSSTDAIISPNGETSFEILFKPLSFGSKEAKVSIENSDPDENPYVFTIKGKATNFEYGWTKYMGVGNGFDKGSGVVTDSSGNMYFAGYFEFTIDFGAKFGGSDSVKSKGEIDAFITKVNANDTYGWTKTIGGTGNDYLETLSIDSSGNLYVTGHFEGTIDFGASFGVSDIRTVPRYTSFITKINSNLTYGWTKLFDSVTIRSAAIDKNDDFYATGAFSNTVNFASDFGSTDNKTSKGQRDLFVTKVMSNGSYGWTKIFGNIKDEYWSVITADKLGNIYIGGFFWDIVNFGADFGISDYRTSAGSIEIFITKLTINGSYGWTKQLYGTGQDQCNGLTTDSSGNVYVTGYFYETVNFGYDFGTTDNKTSIANRDGFVMRINANGSYGWTRCFHAQGSLEGETLTTDGNGDLFVCGSFNSTVDFGTDFSLHDEKTSAGGSDIFITKLKADGSYIETKKLGSDYNDYVQDIVVHSNKIYLTGDFSGKGNFASDFDETDNVNGMNDIFITKILQ